MVPTHQLRFRFGEVKGCAVAFRESTYQEDEEAHGLIADVPEIPCAIRSPGLEPDNFPKAQRTRHHDQGYDGEAHGNFIANHLCRSADGAKEREFVIGSPSADHNAVDTQRNYTEDIEQ